MHDFHMVLPQDLYSKMKLFASQHFFSGSRAVCNIIDFMMPILDVYHFQQMINRKFDYQRLNAFKDFHIYMDELIYVKLKMVHSHMQTFSMATLIRELLRQFFILYEKHGMIKTELIMKRYHRRYIKPLLKKRKWKKKKRIQHMSYGSSNRPLFSCSFTKIYDLIEFEFF